MKSEINEKTRIPLIWVTGIVTVCVLGGIWAYQLRRDVSDIKNFLQACWTREDQRDWSHELERKNPEVHVPDVPRSAQILSVPIPPSPVGKVAVMKD